jgi:hypothetical protein
MPARKRVDTDDKAIPPDDEITAYEEMMRAREHLVAVLRAAGVIGFTSL